MRAHTGVTERLQQLKEKVNSELGLAVPDPVVRYRLRGTSAGRTTFHSGEIDFNPILLVKNEVQFLDETVPHEYSHYLGHFIHGQVQFAHGREWQALMKMFGVKPKVTHDYDVSHVAPTFEWHCQCTTHQVSRTIHKRMTVGEIYQCDDCGSDLVQYQSGFAPLN